MSERLQIFTNAADMRAFSRQQRMRGKTVAFIPTMGHLHEGHLALVTAAREQADIVVASIYVNPTQFAKHEDFDQYPRQREADRQKLQAAGCHACFEPASLYASPAQRSESEVVVGVEDHQSGAHETFIQVEQLQRGLCSRSRPTFFRGVATVVAKLFNIVEPDVALFGRKDYQQWRLLERMARDLDFPVRIIGLPIFRHEDGLAMSSRNAMLTEEHRQKAPCIHAALQWAQQAAQDGSCTDAGELAAAVTQRISDGGGRVDYVEVVDGQELQPVKDVREQPTLVAIAAFFGSVRLIDNIEVQRT